MLTILLLLSLQVEAAVSPSMTAMNAEKARLDSIVSETQSIIVNTSKLNASPALRREEVASLEARFGITISPNASTADLLSALAGARKAQSERVLTAAIEAEYQSCLTAQSSGNKVASLWEETQRESSYAAMTLDERLELRKAVESELAKVAKPCVRANPQELMTDDMMTPKR